MAYVPRTAGARPVQVLAIEGGFPFYGTHRDAPAGTVDAAGRGRGRPRRPVAAHDVRRARGRHPEPRRGQASRSAAPSSTIRVTSASAPPSARACSFPSTDVGATGLLRFGSRARYDALPQAAGRARMRRRLADRAASAWLVRARQHPHGDGGPALAQQLLGRLGRYLSLVGLVALLLGGLGVASAVRALIKKKMETIAVLRCLGATAGQIFAAYLLQAVALGLVGSALAGAMIGVVLQWLLPRLMRGPAPRGRRVRARCPPSIATGLALGAWVAGLFSLLPLLSIRDVSALAVLRRAFEPRRAAGVTRGALAAVRVLVAQHRGPRRPAGPESRGRAHLRRGHRRRPRPSLWGAALLLMKAVRRWFPTRWPYVWRQGLANLYRPANQTAMVILALGFGAFLLDTVYRRPPQPAARPARGRQPGPAEPRPLRHPARPARGRARAAAAARAWPPRTRRCRSCPCASSP